MNRKMGYIPSPKDLRDYKIAKSVRKQIVLPEEFQLIPTMIKDQGDVGSCVAHAVSSALEADQNVMFSTGWIYGYRPEDYYQDVGMIPREALKTIQKVGAVKFKNFPYNIEMQRGKVVVDNNLTVLTNYANEFKIHSYAKLSTIQEIKEFLYTVKLPVPFAINTYNGMDIDENNIIKIPDFENEECTGGHMMLILGWNEKGFILQNSWGIEWGNKGLAILPYEYPISEAWGLTIDAPVEPEVEIEPIQPVIVKPDFYWIRKILQYLLNLINGKLK